MKLYQPSTIKELRDRFGFRFSKSLGQNFLTDKNIIDSIIEGSGVTGDDLAIEIGPGIGVITRELAQIARKVIAIEIDTDLLPILQVTLGDLEIPAKDGVAWIRLGKYVTPPKVIVREAWDKGLSIQLVGKDGKALRASGSRGSEGVAWIPVQIDNKNRTLSGALGQAPDFRYSFNKKGVMQTGWQKIGKKWYYFRKDGVMAGREFVNGFWLGKTGAGVSGFRAFWKKDAGGWKYGTASGWVVRNMTLTIDGKLYTFDARGYATRGK